MASRWPRRSGRSGSILHRWPRPRIQPAGFLGYLEVHIEQGPVLETLGTPVGVVEAIAGQSRIWVEFRGRAGHAGTLPMEDRLDALAAAAELVLEVERLGRSVPDLRATVGTIAVGPRPCNVVPGSARLSIDVRHARDEVRMTALAELRARADALAARRGVEWLVVREEHHAAVPADPVLSGLLGEAVAAAGHAVHRVTSGAGHDAAVMAAVAPMAMLFLRSPGGVSHHPDESVLPGDVVVALDVMVVFLDLLADRLGTNVAPTTRFDGANGRGVWFPPNMGNRPWKRSTHKRERGLHLNGVSDICWPGQSVAPWDSQRIGHSLRHGQCLGWDSS